MQRWVAIGLVTLLLVALAGLSACRDVEKADVPPPGSGGDEDGGGGWNCDISNKGLAPIDFEVACTDPTGGDNGIGLAEVLGAGEVLVDGSRLQLAGSFNFSTISAGKIEASIGCADYDKCSYPFDAKQDDFVLRVDAAGCPDISKPQEVTIKVNDDDTGESNAFCTVFLGGLPTDDDDDTTEPWDCTIPADGLTPVPYTANCWEPLGDGGTLTITAVTGTGPELVDGARFEITGQHAFVGVTEGRLEPVVGCPPGSAYPKCSWPFDAASGEFRTRVQVADCDPPPANPVIVINRHDTAAGQTVTVCEITVGEAPTDDDSTD